jgi:uncharacterized protein
MLRTSSYVIYVDLPDNREEMLIVHGYSGAYDRVSRNVGSYLRSLEAGPAPAPLYGAWSSSPSEPTDCAPPSEATIERLKKRGYLTEKTKDDEEQFFTQVADQHHGQMQHGRLTYILMPTYDCNLRCSYCFQDHMRTNPAFGHLLRTMQPSMIDRMLKAWTRIEARHHMPAGFRRDITFFGGEPLLARLRPTIESILEKTKALGQARFGAITNATDLDAYRDLLHPEGISWLQITLDGPQREHDQRRIYADGSGSYERIARNLTMALEQGVRVSVRMNIDRTNIDQLPELADEIVARGWNRYSNFSAYTAPIHANNGKTEVTTTLSSWQLDKALTQMREEYPNMQVISLPDDGMLARVQRLFERQSDPSAFFKSSFCGAHNGMYVFDAFGDIYSCWERTGNPGIRIASITEDGDVVWDEATQKLWRSRSVTSNPTCRKCRYALYCGGGCAVLAMDFRHEFFTNFCDGFGSRFRYAVAKAYENNLAQGGAEAARERESVCGS